MAKQNESKSETVTGGSKAADFKPGGRAETHSPEPDTKPPVVSSEPTTQAPVTTDAAASTPASGAAAVPGNDSAGAIRSEGKFSRADVEAGKPKTLHEQDREQFGLADLDKPVRSKPRAVSGDMAPVTVKDFLGQVKEFTQAAKNRDWLSVLQGGSAILNTFAALVSEGNFFQATQADAAALSECAAVESELAACRADVGSHLASRGNVSLRMGDEPHPVSGAAMPLTAAQPDVKTSIDPQTLLVVVELVGKLLAWFRQRNQ